MKPSYWLIGCSLFLFTGCTHRQLAQSTVKTTSTVMDIQYRTVLTNLAMLSCHPGSLPSHIDLAEGVVQVSDEAGFGSAGGITALKGTGVGIESFGPSGSRQVSEQWDLDPTTDPQRLTELQELYRTALGLPLLPPPNAISFLREEQARKGKKEGEGNLDKGSGDDKNRRVPIEILLSDVPPPGWFQLGSCQDVPKNACYVGSYGDRYAWVTPEGIPSLGRFTVTVLSVVKLRPGEPGTRRGLTFTR